MKRDPSLHIRRSHLIQVLEKIPYWVSMTEEQLANALLQACKPHSITGRVQLKEKTTVRKKAERMLDVNAAVIEKFNGVLTSERIAAGHRGVRQLKKTDKEYAVLVEVATIADQFAREFKLEQTAGYKQFIQLGLRKMNKKYGLNKFKFYSEIIFADVDALEKINLDPTPKISTAMFRQYNANLQAMTGQQIDLSKDPAKYVNFVYAAADMLEVNGEPKLWIDAQFAGLAFVNAVPELSQIHGDNAKHRYFKFLQNGAIETKKTTPEEVRQYADDEEKWYFEIYLPSIKKK